MSDRERINGLLDEDFISIYPSLAMRVGINKAAILQKLHYLIQITKNSDNQANYIEGRWWVYNTYSDWETRYFPWLAASTLKRLFLELEQDGIVLSWSPPDNPHKKYYTIDYDFWPTWFEQVPQTQPRIKKRRGSSQNDTTHRIKVIRPSYQNDTTIVSKRDDPHIYKESENTQKRQSENTQTPPTTSAPARQVPAEPVAPAAGVGGVVGGGAETEQISEDDLAFILPEVRKLHLSAEAQKRLLGLGAQTALAIAFAARAQGVRNPGGLAVKLMDNGGPSEADQQKAALALELRTLNPQELESHQRRRDYARLMEQMSMLAKAPEPFLPASPPASPMIPQPAEPAQPAQPAEPARQPAPPAPSKQPAPAKPTPPAPSKQPSPKTQTTPDGLDEELGAMTVRDWFVMTLMQWEVRWNKPAYSSYFAPLQPVRYADGVLTVRATTPLAYQWMSAKGRVTLYVQETLQRVSGLPLQVRLIGPDESIEEPEPGDAVVAAEVAAQPEQGGLVSAERGEGQSEGVAEPEQRPAEAQSAGSAEAAGDSDLEQGAEARPGFEPHVVWRQVKHALASETEWATYETVLARSRPLDYADGVLRVGFSTPQARDTAERLWGERVEQMVTALAGEPVQVRLVVDEDGTAEPLGAGHVGEGEPGPAEPVSVPVGGEPAEPPVERAEPPELDPSELPGLWQQVLAHLREHGLFANRPELHRLQVAGYADGVVGLRAASWPDYRELETRALTLGYLENLLRTQAGQPVQLRLLPPDTLQQDVLEQESAPEHKVARV